MTPGARIVAPELDVIGRYAPFALWTDRDLIVRWISPSVTEGFAGVLGNHISDVTHAPRYPSTETSAGGSSPIDLIGDGALLPLMGEWIRHEEGFLLLAHRRLGPENCAPPSTRGNENREGGFGLVEKRLALALDGASMGIWEWNIRSGEVVTDRRGRNGSSHRLKERRTTIRSFFERLHPDDLRPTKHALREHFRGRAPVYEIEHRSRDASGGYHRLHERGKVVERDERGLPLRLAGVFLDLTEQEAAENARRRSEERYRSLVESIDALIWEVDREGRFTYASPRFRTMLGREPKEILGRPIIELLPEGEAGCVSSLFRKKRKGGEPFGPVETRILRKEGGEIVLETRAVPFHDETGRLLGYRALSRDITERIQTEDALRGGEERYRRLVEMMGEGLGHQDENNIVRYVNDRFCEIVGYAREELIGRHAMDLVDESHREDVASRYQKRRNGIGGTFDTVLLRKDGSPVDVRITSSPVIEEGNRYGGTISVFMDITEKTRAEAALKEYARRLEILNRIVKIANRAPDPESLLREVLRATMELMNFDGGGVYMLEEGADEAVMVRHDGLPDPFRDAVLRLSAKEGPFRELFREGRSIVSPIAPEARLELSMEPFFSCFAAVPALDGDRIVGSIHIASTVRHAFTRQETETLEAIGRELGTALARLRAEERIRDSEEVVRALLNAPTDSAFLLDLEGKILAVNAIAAERFGRSPKEMTGRNFFDFNPPHLAHARREKMAETIRDARPVRFENKRAGMVFDTNIYPVFNAEGAVCRVALFARNITAQKKAEQALLDSENRYRTVSELTSDLTYQLRMEPDGRLVPEWVTGAIERITGYRFGEIASLEDWRNFVVEEDRKDVRRAFQTLLRGRIAIDEFRIRDKRGNIHWLRHYGRPIEDEETGKVKLIRGAVQDITDRRTTEEALRHKRAYLESIFRAAPTGIGVVSNRVFREVNKRLCEMLGYGEEELIGQSARMVYVSEEEFDWAGREKYGQIRERGTGTLETRWMRKDGRVIDVLLSSTPIDASDFTKGVTFTALDITERKEWERALGESERKYRLLVENQTDLLVEIDLEGRILFASPSYCELFGKTEEHLSGKKFLPLGHGPEQKATLELMEMLLRPPHLAHQERREFTADGPRWLAWAHKAVPDEEGRIRTIVAVGRDITLRKQREMELQDSEERLRILFERAPDACFLTDPEGTFLDANRATEELTGYGKEELAGRNLVDLKMLSREHLTGAGPRARIHPLRRPTREQSMKRRDGTALVIETRAYPVTIQGKAQVLAIARDVTARHRAENERTRLLRDIEERVKELNCLYGISNITDQPDTPLEEMFRDVVDWIPSALQNPEKTCARICYRDEEYGTDNYRETDWALTGVIRAQGAPVGTVDIRYLEDPVENSGGVSIREKQNLINAVAKRLGGTIERVRAERSLAEKERLYRTLIESVPHVIWLADRDGGITYINPAWKEITGREPEQSLGSRWAESLHPDDLFRVLAQWEGSCKKGREFGGEARFLSREGAYRILSYIGTPVLDEQGRVEMWAGINTDMTDYRDAEEERRRAHAFLDSIIENLPNMLYVKSAKDLSFVRLNRAGEKLLGRPRDELLGRSIYELYPIQDAVFSTANDREVLKGKRMVEIPEETLQTRDRGLRVLHTKKIPLLDERGEPEYLLGISQDITEHKRAQDSLRLQSQIVENMREGVCLIRSVDGRIAYANPAFEGMCGYDPGELIQCHAGVLDLPPEERSGERSATDVILRLGDGKSWNGEVRNRRKDGSGFWCRVGVSTFDHPGYGRVWVAVFEDTTERKLLQNQLLQAQKLEAIGQLASGIAHEINTPIQYVGDNTHFLADSLNDLIDLAKRGRRLLETCDIECAGAEEFRHFREALERVDLDYVSREIPRATEQTLEGIEHVVSIVQAMREFSGQRPKDKTLTDLNRIVRNTLTFSRHEYKYAARVSTDLDGDLPPVPCLPSEFTQVMLNLVVNAVHAIEERYGKKSPVAGTIHIASRRDGDWAVVRVSDDGAGIPAENHHRVFDPFFTTKEVGRGSGQGLAIAHSVVVDKLAGSISFETEEGRGTTFTIRLPIEDPHVPQEGGNEGTHTLR
ncbi:MAG: PAS domain S-box protein [Candidatus Eisenbacteria bacterium]|nr:PAS domain S-box protein [Candidatus Eisenbacteria bacterium]